MSEPLLLERRDDAAWLILDRPDARNALSRELIAALTRAVDALGAELAANAAAVRAVVVTGRGTAFCAGADLKERLGMSREETRELLSELGDLMDGLAALPVPIIAAINGPALGGGLELALACDLRVAARGATLGLPEAHLGIIPGAGGTQRLTRLVGPALAKEMIFTGGRIDAETAQALGVVNHVVDAPELPQQVALLLQRLGAVAPLAVREAKRAIDDGQGLPLRTALALERRCYDVVLETADRDEGLRAFAEKRPPIYRGK